MFIKPFSKIPSNNFGKNQRADAEESNVNYKTHFLLYEKDNCEINQTELQFYGKESTLPCGDRRLHQPNVQTKVDALDIPRVTGRGKS